MLDEYATGQEIAAEADYQAMLDDDATARAEMIAQCEAEAAEQAYLEARNSDDDIYICGACGLISPLCACDLAVERKVDERLPWPNDPAALTEAEATTLTAARFNFRREERVRFFGAIALTAFISFSMGAYAAVEIVTSHVKAELQENGRIR